MEWKTYQANSFEIMKNEDGESAAVSVPLRTQGSVIVPLYKISGVFTLEVKDIFNAICYSYQQMIDRVEASKEKLETKVMEDSIKKGAEHQLIMFIDGAPIVQIFENDVVSTINVGFCGIPKDEVL